MSRKNQAAQAATQAPAPEAVEVEVVETVEAAEPPQPEGVETTDAEPPAPDTDQVQNTPGYYLVAWHIKTGGQRYAPGQFVELEDDVAEPFLKSEAILPAVKA